MLETLKQLLSRHATVKIATTDGRRPWIAAAFFAEEDPFTLLLMLEGHGLTLSNIDDNPAVAVMLESGDAFTLFAQGYGRAERVADQGARFAAAIAGKTPASAPLMAIPGQTPVRISIEQWRLTDVSAGWLPARELCATRFSAA